ncbi:MAG: CDP-glycerol glycerophosphotransferase family protein [Clostridiaceae bacterium]|nr:CDP-glycerol glycerophosphotransferase family protein [Clostridiaceae bacterium]
MQDSLSVKEQWIDQQNDHLHLRAVGELHHAVANQKLRIVVLFRAGSLERRFPVDAFCVTREATDFQLKADISLPDVFLEFSGEQASQPVTVSFSYCDAVGSWHVLPGGFSLDGAHFRKRVQKNSPGYRLFRGIAYVLCTIFLPLWLLDGYFVWKGYKISPYLANEVKGKKIIFYHAHGLVKSITGHGYSPREIKTGYFARCYRKFCRRISDAQGVLFLSEREIDAGGNLDLVRREWAARGKAYQEFIDTRQIHALPFSAIRHVAKLAASARVIVLEDFYPQINALSLRPQTKLVQLWHACGAFKMFGLSELGKVEKLEQDTRNHRNYSVAFTSGKQIIPFYSEAFGLADAQVKALGVPRTDIFFRDGYREEIQEKLYQKYPMLKGKRIVLFAPTFRGSGNRTAFYPAERFHADQFMARLPEDTVLILKNHPFVKERFTWGSQYEQRVLDLTGRENINDLLFITSVLITDYSSSIFEAALLQIPMLFYVFDLEEYMAARDLYFDFASFAPGIQVTEEQDLAEQTEAVLAGDYKPDGEKLQAFCDYFLDALDGHSTERIADYLETLE